MTPEEIRRRLVSMAPNPEPIPLGPEPTAGEIKEHFNAMQRDYQTPARIAQVYARQSLLFEQAEIGLYNYRRFFAGGRNWSIDDG